MSAGQRAMNGARRLNMALIALHDQQGYNYPGNDWTRAIVYRDCNYKDHARMITGVDFGSILK